LKTITIIAWQLKIIPFYAQKKIEEKDMRGKEIN